MIGKEGGRNVARKKLETLTEQMYYILLSLAGEPRHGYGIMQDVSPVSYTHLTLPTTSRV